MPKSLPPVATLIETLKEEFPVHSKVVGLIRRRGSCTRQDVAQFFGWLQPSTSKVIKKLTDMNLITVEAMRLSEGERRRDYLCINPELGYAIGVETDCAQCRVGLVRIDGQVVEISPAFSISHLSPEQGLVRIAQTVNEFKEKYKDRPLLGVGLASLCVHNDLEDPSKPVSVVDLWTDVPTRTIMERECGLKTTVIYDLWAQMLAEMRYGHALDAHNMFYLSMKGGIALGVLSNRRIHRGHNGDSGEFGHICVDPEGSYCHCGGQGCLETVASSWAIIRQVKDLIERGLAPALARKFQEQTVTLEMISQQAAQGVVLAENILEKAGQTIGNLLAMFANCLDPAMIILSGVLCDETTHSVLISSLKRSFRKGLYPASARPEVAVLPTRLQTDASLVGAAAAVFEENLPAYPLQLLWPEDEEREEFAPRARGKEENE